MLNRDWCQAALTALALMLVAVSAHALWNDGNPRAIELRLEAG